MQDDDVIHKESERNWGMRLVIKRTSWRSFGIAALECVWAAMVILDGNSVYRHLADRNMHLPFLSLLASVILVCIKGHIRKKAVMTGLFLFAYMLLYYLMQRGNVADEVFICMMLLGIPILVMLFDTYIQEGQTYRLFLCVSNLIFVLTVLSLAAWLLGSVLHAIPSDASVRVKWGTEKTINGYFGLQYDCAKDTTYGVEFYRNQSLFTEAPMYSLWLCISLSAEMFLRGRVQKVKCVVFLLGIVSTISTTGLLFCVLVFGLKYFESITKGSTVRKVILVFLLSMLLPAGIALLQVVYDYKYTTASFAIRLQDYIVGWQAFTEHPLFGTGYGSLVGISSSTGILAGYSNSIMALFGTGGLWIAAVFLASLFGYFVFRDTKDSGATAKFGICYLFLFILTIFFARYIAAVFYGFGLSLLMNTKHIKAMEHKGCSWWGPQVRTVSWERMKSWA